MGQLGLWSMELLTHPDPPVHDWVMIHNQEQLCAALYGTDIVYDRSLLFL